LPTAPQERTEIAGMYERLKKRVYQILEDPGQHDPLGRLVQVFLIGLIVMNVVAIVMETVRDIREVYLGWFVEFEIFSIIVFSIEYLLRLWVAPLQPRYRGVRLPRVRYMFSLMALIDLLAILPFYLPLTFSLDLRFLRTLRLMRIVRLLKIGRYSESLRTMAAVFHDQREHLFSTALIIAVLVVVSASLVYYAEHDAQEDFSSIPATMWWAIATLTTLGYGDMRPITTLGKSLAAIISILGIGLVALPAGILGSGFVDRLRQKRNGQKCPHCGKDLHAPRHKPPEA
jgi:voltage-gated potassium channel